MAWTKHIFPICASALLLTAGVTVLQKTAPASAATAELAAIKQAAIANPRDAAAVEAYLNTLVEVPKDSGLFLVEGDILMSKSEIQSYLLNRGPARAGQTSPEARLSKELIVNVVNGQFDYLRTPEDRALTYSIVRESFPSAERAAETLANFQKAAGDWVEACPECGVTFTLLEEGSTETPDFTLSFVDEVAGPIARAFFPSYPSDLWQVNVFPSYFSPNLSFDRVGVLRHEIGHVLGFRHEHIGNIPGCRVEGGTFQPITPYTPNSVMHYLCGEGGSFDLALRDDDIRGFRCLYTTGEPCPQTQ